MDTNSYTAIPPDAAIGAVAASLGERGFIPVIVGTGAEALEQIKNLVPAGASVMNGSSTTLKQIGFVDYLKAGQHSWRNVHEEILAEKDPAKQAVMRAQSVLADFFLVSVHAITQGGQLLWASATGSQMPSIAYTSPNVIIVASANKIVQDLDAAFKRVTDYVFALEDKRMKDAGYAGSGMNKWFVFEREFNPERKIHIVLVKEPLGF